MEDSFKYFLIILDIYFPIFDVTYIELDKKRIRYHCSALQELKSELSG